MKRSIRNFAIAATAMLLMGCYGDDIDSINSRLDTLEGTTLPTVNQQIETINATISDLKTVDATLEASIQALKDKDSNLETSIAELKAKDASLGESITNLQQYVDNELKNTKDWASSTLVTLEQYYALQAELSALKLTDSKGDSTLAATIADIEKSIAACEESMKQWVNTTLASGYYDIAAIDAKLKTLQDNINSGDAALWNSMQQGDKALQDSIKNGDAALQTQIDALKTNLTTAKSDLTAAYTSAITEAINDYDGTIKSHIAEQIATAQSATDSKLKDISDDLAALENRVSALESRIQSIVFIPKYTHGKAEAKYNIKTSKWETELDFLITPAAAVVGIEAADIAITAVQTISATRAVRLIVLPVLSVWKDNMRGVITVNVSCESLSGFIDGSNGAAAFMRIADGNNDVTSENVQLTLNNIIQFSASGMTADTLQTAVTQALEHGFRDFSIGSDLTGEQQKALTSALNSFCNLSLPSYTDRAGTVSLELLETDSIAEQAFYVDNVANTALKSVRLPAATHIGSKAFYASTYLETVTAPKVKACGDSVFGWCHGLQSADFPELQRVSDYMFYYCYKLVSVNVPKATALGQWAFSECHALQNIHLPKVTEVHPMAFRNCHALQSVAFGTPITHWQEYGGTRWAMYNTIFTNEENTQNINITLYLNDEQKVLTKDEYKLFTPAEGADNVSFGTDKSFCDYTIKEIRPYSDYQ